MTRREFKKILKKEKIPRKWVSLNGSRKAPVTLSGDTLYYGKHGVTKFLQGIDYEYILERLREYKTEQEFIQSNEIAQITDITIVSTEFVREYGDVFVVTRSYYDKNPELLRQGFEYIGYDYYMGDYSYQKECGDEIFTEIEIGLKVKTQDFEREQYGFEDIVMNSSVTFPLPMKLRENIIDYIRKKKSQEISKEDALFQEIISEYDFDNIVEEENNKLKNYDNTYKYILKNELMRQKSLKQFSEEKLKEVYYEQTNANRFISITALSSRHLCLRDLRFLEAKKVLNELIEAKL